LAAVGGTAARRWRLDVSKARTRYCGSPEHAINRRLFLQGGVATALGVTAGGLETFSNRLLASELRRQQKHVLLLWLAGGSSQLETWDPKPGRPTGGPFRAIPTAPGVFLLDQFVQDLAKVQGILRLSMSRRMTWVRFSGERS
jgi:hypothetical protein